MKKLGLREYFAEEGERTVFISARLKDKKGKRFRFVIRGLKEKELEEIKAGSEREFIFEVIKRCVSEPDFTLNEEIEQSLLSGEVYRLYYEIIKIGGFDKSFFELKKQVADMLLRGEPKAVYGCLAAFEMGILPKKISELDRKEKACIGAFIDEKVRIRNKKGR